MVTFGSRIHSLHFFMVMELKLNSQMQRPQHAAFFAAALAPRVEKFDQKKRKEKKTLHDCWKGIISSAHSDPEAVMVVDTAFICPPLYLFSSLFSVITCVHLLLHSCTAAHFPSNSLDQTYGSLHFK